MRKGNFLTILSAGLLVLVFLLASAEYGQAQSNITSAASPKELFGTPKGHFVDATEAEAILSAHVLALKAYLETLPQGSPAYLVTYRASAFYRTIWYSIKDGNKVLDALMDGFVVFNSTYFEGASYTEKLNLREEAIDMLSAPYAPNSSLN